MVESNQDMFFLPPNSQTNASGPDTSGFTHLQNIFLPNEPTPVLPHSAIAWRNPIAPRAQICFLRNEPNPIFGHSCPSTNRRHVRPVINRGEFPFSSLTPDFQYTSGNLPAAPYAQLRFYRNEPNPISGHFSSARPITTKLPHAAPRQATMESPLPPPSAEDCLAYVR
jgi:hypothetical protein